MRKPVIAINILTLFLTSCGSFHGSAEKPVERFPANANLSCQDSIKDLLKKSGTTALSPKDEETKKAIALFANGDESIQKNLTDEFNNQLSGNPADESNEVWKKFTYHKDKVEIQKKKFKSVEKAAIFEKLYYSCKTQIKTKPNAAQLKQAKKLTYALTAGSFGSTVVTYSAVHWDEEKNKKWFSEISFSLGIGVALTFIGGKLVLANPNLHPWKGKMPLAFLNNAVSDAGVSGIYAYAFGTDDTELEKKLLQIQNDPEAMEKLNELLVIAQENNLFEKHLKNTQNLFIDKRTNLPMKSSDFKENLSFDDIDMDASRELLMAALAEQEYDEKSGALATGHPAVDRFSYHRLFNLMSVPTNIGLTILMNNQMCMTADPKKGFAKAVGLYMGVSILMDALYFKGKKEVINQ